MLHETDITVILGLRGCGKSFLGRELSKVYSRRIVFDRLQEWKASENPCQITVSDFQSFAAEYKRLCDSDSFLLVYQPVMGLSPEESDGVSNAILRTIYINEKAHPLGLALLFEEVWFYAPSFSMLDWFAECNFTGRHARLAIIASSQRPASINKSLISQASNVFIGKLYEPRDIKYLSEAVGEIAEKARDLKEREFIYYRIGEEPRIISTES